ncbi:MAG: phosphoglucomutase, alpha-D-glucose phosphate-specific [Hyphomonadaceae bacterium]
MTLSLSPHAGEPAPQSILIDVERLTEAYYGLRPDASIPAQRIAFGTSGHRGAALESSFNEAHVAAISQAICDYRAQAGIDGPLFIGIDTHALSRPAFMSAVEVFAGNGVQTMIDEGDGYTPTPVVSHAILRHNLNRTAGFADGVVISPSHNPPDQGGFKYNPAHGGPAGSEVTSWIERVANDLMKRGLRGVRRVPFAQARRAPCVHRHDFTGPYVDSLADIVDMDAIRASGLRIGIDPLGGAAAQYWTPVIERYGINATLVNDAIDPTFAFMTLDWDGKIRMDCSSSYAMARLVAMRERFDIAFATDTDADRHGIVCPSAGLLAPNQYLVAACAYLLAHRPFWRGGAAIGATMVSSAMIGRMAQSFDRDLYETPVGFKWFSSRFLEGGLAFAGEESAGATFLKRDGSVWTTDKDGLVLGLLGAEMTARTGLDPKQFHDKSSAPLGHAWYARTDAAASKSEKDLLGALSADRLAMRSLAGEIVEEVLDKAPGNGQPLGGVKVVSKGGWFAARPSGTEDVYKIYAESFHGDAHLQEIQADAQAAIARVFKRG